jgi:hypothetical protein
MLMCYVDDPLAAIRGTNDRRRLLATIMILVWEAMGFGLAYPKGQLKQTIHWIGGSIECHQWGVTAYVKESIVSDIKSDLRRLLQLQVIPKKELHSLLGKLNHAAGLLITTRPFLQPMWAALACEKPSGAPPGCIWTKQIDSELRWFDAFFAGQSLKLERHFPIEDFLRQGVKVEIGTDASPWGMGGWITVGGKLLHYFAVPITWEDEKLFGVRIGTADGQQIWECLAVLVAVDMWITHWQTRRVILQIRSDNVTALTNLVKMRPKTAAHGIIIRELAMRLAEQSFPPDALHTPGVSHIVADALSRVFAPDGKGIVDSSIHPALAAATVMTPPARNADWFRAYK